MAAKKNEVQKILNLAGEFVTRQEGAWEHKDWERFLEKSSKIGVEIDDESKRILGNVLESTKFLYRKIGITPAVKPAKTKTKKKAKAKAADSKKKPAAKVAKKATKKA